MILKQNNYIPYYLSRPIKTDKESHSGRKTSKIFNSFSCTAVLTKMKKRICAVNQKSIQIAFFHTSCPIRKSPMPCRRFRRDSVAFCWSGQPRQHNRVTSIYCLQFIIPPTESLTKIKEMVSFCINPFPNDKF